MDFILDIVGFMLAAGAAVVVLRTLRIWRGVLRDGLFLFLAGFLLVGAAFIMNGFAAFKDGAFAGSQSLFVGGMALFFWGSFKIFTFVYPQR